MKEETQNGWKKKIRTVNHSDATLTIDRRCRKMQIAETSAMYKLKYQHNTTQNTDGIIYVYENRYQVAKKIFQLSHTNNVSRRGDLTGFKPFHTHNHVQSHMHAF